MAENASNNKSVAVYLLVGLLVVSAFINGSLYTKVKTYEKEGIGGGTAAGAKAGRNNDFNNNAPLPTEIPSAKQDLKITDTDYALGNKNAKVTIVEYTDYQCPFCKRFFEATFGQIKKEYIDTGKIYFAVRDFPLTMIHPNAQKAAEAVQCAGEQKKFYDFHDKLYTSQETWSQDGNDAVVVKFKQYAQQLGLNTGNFNKCLDSGKYKQKVADSSTEGAKFGVQGTPAFFINGTLLSGAQPFEAFKTAIDKQLK